MPGHRLVLAAASPVFRQQLTSGTDATIRLRDRAALPAAEQSLLAHVYGRPLDWPALAPTALAQLLVLAHDHGLPALQQAAAARLLHLLASKRPAGGAGPAVVAAAASVNTPLQRPPCAPSPLEGGAGTALPTPPPAAPAAAAGTSGGGGGGAVCTALQAVHSPYVEALVAVVGLPADVAGSGAAVGLAAAARVLLLDALQDFEAAWQVPSLRRAFLGLPLAAAVEVLSSPHLAVSCEGVVALAALAYEATRSERAAAAAATAAGAHGGDSGSRSSSSSGAAALDTCGQLALYSCVRWHLMHIGDRSHEWNSFLKNAIQRAPHLQRLMEHGTAASGIGGAHLAAATGGVGLAPHPAAVPELAAAAAACGPYQPAASLLDLAQLTQSLLYTRQLRAEAAGGGGGAEAHLPYMARRAGARPRPTGHLQTAVHLQMDVPYVVLREAVARVKARMEEQGRQRKLLERQQQLQQQAVGGAGGVPAATAAALPLAVAPVAAVAVEEDLVGSDLVFQAGYWWQMVVSLGPLCRYRMALAGPSAAPAGGPAVGSHTTSALAAAAAAAAHETDTRLVCFVGVRPLMLLTEAELEAAAGRGVPSGWAGEGGELDGAAAVAAGAAAAARLLPASVYVEQYEVWNERDLPHGKAALGPTAFARAGGFKGTITLFPVGAEALASEAYWAKAVSGPEGALRVRARAAGVH
ncbi:hypothetical protein HYH02_001097 [Chlamydomonas schloesseri]|uniref:BTB domain-containing protein n=1 Tax=Chlamydomonas schloesseri TaxID=2026947 RepID=A0A836BC41_9CHLO|nr:hypothetical protein HYH02_001097 [Chlamydomonas schloesseri]|eukprot:KAG2454056.1 hypothetical protein HYH02_001097 [Chlamydomonas schloesseri]